LPAQSPCGVRERAAMEIDRGSIRAEDAERRGSCDGATRRRKARHDRRGDIGRRAIAIGRHLASDDNYSSDNCPNGLQSSGRRSGCGRGSSICATTNPTDGTIVSARPITRDGGPCP
jgi:hypothetical protein